LVEESRVGEVLAGVKVGFGRRVRGRNFGATALVIVPDEEEEVGLRNSGTVWP
jgi:hypothetical protein